MPAPPIKSSSSGTNVGALRGDRLVVTALKAGVKEFRRLYARKLLCKARVGSSDGGLEAEAAGRSDVAVLLIM
jgi:hypothetical protein